VFSSEVGSVGPWSHCRRSRARLFVLLHEEFDNLEIGGVPADDSMRSS
jgi:hypothetical protein